MPDRTFYTDANGGYSDTSIVAIRKVAIDHLRENEDQESVEIFRSPSKKMLIGTVEVSDGFPIYMWKPERGRSARLNRDGQISHLS